MDLQEQTRRDDVYNDVQEIVNKITELPVFPSLAWVWAWDVIRDNYEANHWDEVDSGAIEDYAVPRGLELKTIWDKFWIDVDKLGLSMEYGPEAFGDVIKDWMCDNNFLVALDDDAWLG